VPRKDKDRVPPGADIGARSSFIFFFCNPLNLNYKFFLKFFSQPTAFFPIFLGALILTHVTFTPPGYRPTPVWPVSCLTISCVGFIKKMIEASSDLPYTGASTPVGKVVAVEVIRQGQKLKLQYYPGSEEC